MLRGPVKRDLSRYTPAGWSTRPFRPGDEAQILALFRRAFRIERSPSYWQWKFGDNPAGYQIIVGETPDGKVVAQIAGVPARMHAQDRQVIFTQVVDLMADPDFHQSLRKAGVYVTLLKAMIEEFGREGTADLIFGFTIRASNRVPQEVFGWHEAHRVRRVARRLDGSPRPGDRGLGLTRARYRVDPLVAFSEQTDRLWTRWRSAVPLAAARDTRYLSWRYGQCPHVRYHPYLLWDRWRDRPAALSVLRLGWEGQPVAAMVEWVVPRGETGAARALLAHAETAARAAGMAELTGWFHPEGPEHRFFLEQGFGEEITPYRLVGNPFSPALPWEWVARHWYYSMGDSDVF